jgi:hypothetical protein
MEGGTDNTCRDDPFFGGKEVRIRGAKTRNHENCSMDNAYSEIIAFSLLSMKAIAMA